MTPAPILSARRFVWLVLATGLAVAGTAEAANNMGSEGSGSGPKVVGSGKLASETRPIGAFQAVRLAGSMNLVIRQGIKEAVQVQSDDNILPLIEATVTDRDGTPTLQIGMVKGAHFHTRSKMVVTVDVVTLRSLLIDGSGDAVADGLKAGELVVRVSGAGDVRLRQLSADTLAVNISGSGDVAASGRTGRLSLSIAGTGDVVTRELQADDVTISIAGSGDASVNARKTLAVSIAGSGDVDYTGEASVKTSIAGSGSVKKH
jgi:hypothetical protein